MGRKKELNFLSRQTNKDFSTHSRREDCEGGKENTSVCKVTLPNPAGYRRGEERRNKRKEEGRGGIKKGTPFCRYFLA